jgi:hypothetical protein
VLGEIDSLHPVFRAAVEQILKDMKAKGWDPIIGSGMRTPDQQDALYAQGRDTLDHVNTLRLRARMPRINAKENAIKVTNAKSGKSYHNMPELLFGDGDAQVSKGYGYAVDIVDKKRGWDIADPNFWKDLGAIAKSYGCEWGGDWKKPDVAHVQMTLIDSPPSDTIAV